MMELFFQHDAEICVFLAVLVSIFVCSYLVISKNKHHQYREDLKAETDCAIRRKQAGLNELPPKSKKKSTRPTQPTKRRMLSAAIDSAALVAVKAFGSYIATLITEWLKPKT